MPEPVFHVAQLRTPAHTPLVGGVESAVRTPCRWTYCDPYDDADIRRGLADADVYIGQLLTPELSAGAERLRLIAAQGAGTDRIDPAAVPAGCTVIHVHEHGPAIAEYVFATVTCLRRNLVLADAALRRNDWSHWIRRAVPTPELSGCTLGLVGLGHIAEHLIPLARAYGMRVEAVTRNPERPRPDAMAPDWVGPMSALTDLLPRVDVLVLALPLTPATRGLLDAAALACLPAGAMVVNPSRGPIIDAPALFEALRAGRLGGAVLDTWWRYPTTDDPAPSPADLPFHKLSNVFMTPHLSAATVETFERRVRILAANIDRFARGEPLTGHVPGLDRSGEAG